MVGLKFLLRLSSKNKVIKPYHPFLNLSTNVYNNLLNLIFLFPSILTSFLNKTHVKQTVFTEISIYP